MQNFTNLSNKYQRIVRDYLEDEGQSQRGLAREVNVSSEIVNRIVKGQNPNVQLDTLVKVLGPTDYTIELHEE